MVNETKVMNLIRKAYKDGRSDQLQEDFPDVGVPCNKSWSLRRDDYKESLQKISKDMEKIMKEVFNRGIN